MCHRLNTAIEKAYTKSLQTNTYLKSADEAITGVIGYANRSNLQNKLPIKLKSGSQTRPWRRYSDRFKSIFESYEALEQKLPVFFLLNYTSQFHLYQFKRLLKNIESQIFQNHLLKNSLICLEHLLKCLISWSPQNHQHCTKSFQVFE